MNMAIISIDLLQKIRIFACLKWNLTFHLSNFCSGFGFYSFELLSSQNKRMTISEYQYSHSIVILFYYSKPITDYRAAFNDPHRLILLKIVMAVTSLIFVL